MTFFSPPAKLSVNDLGPFGDTPYYQDSPGHCRKGPSLFFIWKKETATMDFQALYKSKLTTAEEAVKLVKSEIGRAHV